MAPTFGQPPAKAPPTKAPGPAPGKTSTGGMMPSTTGGMMPSMTSTGGMMPNMQMMMPGMGMTMPGMGMISPGMTGCGAGAAGAAQPKQGGAAQPKQGVGFSKAKAASMVGPGGPVMTNMNMGNSPGDLLRRGEELLRQGTLLQQQNEAVRKQQEDERLKAELQKKRDEELEKRKQEMERQKREAEEAKRQKEEEEARVKKEADDAAQELQAELTKILDTTESDVKRAVEVAAKLDPADLDPQVVVQVASEFEEPGSSAAEGVKACFEFMEGKHLKLKGNAEATMTNCTSLLKRTHAAKQETEKATAKVRAKEKVAGEIINAQSIQAELETLILAGQEEVDKVQAIQSKLLKAAGEASAEASSGPEAGGGELDKEVVRIATEMEEPGAIAVKAVQSAMSVAETNIFKIRGPVEETRNAAKEITGRAYKLKQSLEEILQKAKPIKTVSAQRVEREAKKLAAKKEAERQEALFKEYDKDGDGKLSAAEILAYAAGPEFGIALVEDKLKNMLMGQPDGVTWANFPKLRTQVSIVKNEIVAKERAERVSAQTAIIRQHATETSSALSGVESEVAKAEAKVRLLSPLIPRVAQFLDMVSESTESAESAIEAARDFLAAAKEQAQSIAGGDKQAGYEQEAKNFGNAESKKLSWRINSLESRLTSAAQVAKAARAKVDLAERKAALLREASLM
eukprot:TRINITY_DN34635_c1_g2_i1.p1 TRINITY_DN34635_c1_g2~~TRINITY_DN34635_c1_g2_i1.p1  ORF type:complete len:796 (-),score=247.27 TRINITY_DN34635_c1_g2_i1:52-2109(-)